MTSVEFSNAALADAIKRANIVAPTRGSELDRFKGFVFQVDPDTETVVLRVTNGEVFYTEVLYPKSISGTASTWRISSVLFHIIITNLPIKADSVVSLDDNEKTKLRIKSKTLKASTPFIRAQDYPQWDIIDTSEMTAVKGLAEVIDRVSWAAAKDNIPPKSSVQLTSGFVAATSMGICCKATFDLELNGVESICIPHERILPVARMMEEMKVGATGNWLVLSPNEDIVIRCSIIDPTGFPDVEKLFERVNYQNVVMFSKSEASDILKRVSGVGSMDRQKSLLMMIGGGTLTFAMRDSSSSEEAEETVMDSSGSFDEHDEVKYKLSYELFKDAVDHTPGSDVILTYDPANVLKPIKLTGQDGYSSVLQPRKEIAGKEDKT